ncbi:MAG: L-serine ammonia-lyase, iron-sulfur-dependent, subunit alpha [Aminobacterium sp.]|jgi:L-cysteine desulfidase|nr:MULTISPECIES: L-serine ammonia-lyase, iron-sulfur-dependent, subunit alpha [unclassified Aminobacterium]MDD2207675.1 L-serine ammonia-lyase, iron-sulfur-dependent, subunit alpha [Aminobacterium sp.]MDD3426287.1 L-serine ammonia-lyase, iron-sulfur-dependent, subunit alpha [Aminobacterium sp.]MDD3708499.1 L-serine ammonia-lyase, iron-sulfur-dependent, subunit alpha [Aminobacterium sp.]MDD4229701.1 L-serine ammonia-lyase, iron-sulfur-dependent, subunit alpha [Aminobacterium sp.]MDD4552504.1 L-
MFTVKEFLHSEVKPALGCTEPGAVALAVARAWEEAGREKVRNVEATVSSSIYKNGIAVGIPGTNGLKGNVIAAALAVICGHADYGLEVLRDCTDNAVTQAESLIEQNCVKVLPDMNKHGVYVRAIVTTEHHTAECVIEGSHTNIVKVTLDGKSTYALQGISQNANKNDEKSIPDQIKAMSYRDLVSIMDNMDEEDIDYVMEGVRMNMEIAELGLDPKRKLGLGVGKSMMKYVEDGDTRTLGNKIKAISAAASDARMGGAPLPVMSSAGSGNHGITAILPVYIVAEHYHKNKEEMAKAITLSHLTTSFLKSRMGRLSPVCGCSVAAGAGAAAGITFLLSKDLHKVEKAVEILVSNLVGMLCDGAKDTCALKVGTGAYEAYCAAMIVLDGNELDGPQGVVDETIEKTVANAAAINIEGMTNVDNIIIDFVSRRYAEEDPSEHAVS